MTSARQFVAGYSYNFENDRHAIYDDSFDTENEAIDAVFETAERIGDTVGTILTMEVLLAEAVTPNITGTVLSLGEQMENWVCRILSPNVPKSVTDITCDAEDLLVLKDGAQEAFDAVLNQWLKQYVEPRWIIFKPDTIKNITLMVAAILVDRHIDRMIREGVRYCVFCGYDDAAIQPGEMCSRCNEYGFAREFCRVCGSHEPIAPGIVDTKACAACQTPFFR